MCGQEWGTAARDEAAGDEASGDEAVGEEAMGDKAGGDKAERWQMAILHQLLRTQQDHKEGQLPHAPEFW